MDLHAAQSAGEVRARDLIAKVLLDRAEALGGFVPLSELAALPLPDGNTRRVIDPGGGGIWNPRDMAATLAITTSPDGPYADREMVGGLLRYHYQSGPEGGKNIKLRRAMQLGLPIIRFQKIAPNAYMPIYPVYVIDDDERAREFTIAVGEDLQSIPSSAPATELERKYVERLVRQRVHQPQFRARVMLAYRATCTVCELKRAPLLDAAHIIGDVEEHGDASVTNGLSLCKIHHAAYDQDLLGISPDYSVHINVDLLEETDGPMLRHGLQEMHGRTIAIPKAQSDHPDRDRLDERFRRFQTAS